MKNYNSIANLNLRMLLIVGLSLSLNSCLSTTQSDKKTNDNQPQITGTASTVPLLAETSDTFNSNPHFILKGSISLNEDTLPDSHELLINDLIFLEEKNAIILSKPDQFILIHDNNDGKIRIFDKGEGHGAMVGGYELGYFPKLNWVFAGGHDNLLTIWDFESSEIVYEHIVSGPIISIDADVQSNLIAYSAGDSDSNGKTQIYNVLDLSLINSIEESNIRSVKFLPNQENLIALGLELFVSSQPTDRAVVFYDYNESKVVNAVFEGNGADLLTLSKDSRYLASQVTSENTNIKIYNLELEQEIRLDNSEVSQFMTKILFSDDGNYIYALDRQETFYVWSTSGEFITSLHVPKIRNFTTCSHGLCLITTSRNGYIEFWEFAP